MTEINDPDKSLPPASASPSTGPGTGPGTGTQLLRLVVGVAWVLGALGVIVGFFWLMWPYLKPVLLRFYD